MNTTGRGVTAMIVEVAVSLVLIASMETEIPQGSLSVLLHSLLPPLLLAIPHILIMFIIVIIIIVAV